LLNKLANGKTLNKGNALCPFQEQTSLSGEHTKLIYRRLMNDIYMQQLVTPRFSNIKISLKR